MSEFWNARFDTPEYIFGTAPNAFLATQAHRLRPGQRALAVADGEGRNGVWLAEQGLEVHAVEVAPNAIAKARRLATTRGVTLQIEEADLLTWDWRRPNSMWWPAFSFNSASRQNRRRSLPA